MLLLQRTWKNLLATTTKLLKTPIQHHASSDRARSCIREFAVRILCSHTFKTWFCNSRPTLRSTRSLLLCCCELTLSCARLPPPVIPLLGPWTGTCWEAFAKGQFATCLRSTCSMKAFGASFCQRLLTRVFLWPHATRSSCTHWNGQKSKPIGGMRCRLTF